MCVVVGRGFTPWTSETGGEAKFAKSKQPTHRGARSLRTDPSERTTKCPSNRRLRLREGLLARCLYLPKASMHAATGHCGHLAFPKRSNCWHFALGVYLLYLIYLPCLMNILRSNDVISIWDFSIKLADLASVSAPVAGVLELSSSVGQVVNRLLNAQQL